VVKHGRDFYEYRSSVSGGLQDAQTEMDRIGENLSGTSSDLPKNPDVRYEFVELGRAAPGTELDVLEETMIRRLGGPRSDPGGLLENIRHQMNPERYYLAGGAG
jgi:hypothetical protein